jgi:hypothetical protein
VYRIYPLKSNNAVFSGHVISNDHASVFLPERANSGVGSKPCAWLAEMNERLCDGGAAVCNSGKGNVGFECVRCYLKSDCNVADALMIYKVP